MIEKIGGKIGVRSFWENRGKIGVRSFCKRKMI
jgi:hypothetical protein